MCNSPATARSSSRAGRSPIAAGAQLTLYGNDAFIEDSTALGSNSALTGLASIIAGVLDLENGASVSTTGALANDGIVVSWRRPATRRIDPVDGGALTNTGSAGYRQPHLLVRLRYGEILRQ